MDLKIILLSILSNFLYIKGIPIPSSTEFESVNNQRDRFFMAVMHLHNKPCMGRFHSLQGICIPKYECKRKGGTYLGPCAIFGACCSLKSSCLGETSSKVSYFESPSTISSSICNYKVNLINEHVCQIRLDFEVFDLLPFNGVAPSCEDQYLEISSGKYPPIKIPRFCGINSRQHIYIPVTSPSVLISIYSKESTITGSWRIKITQLECINNEHIIDIAAPVESFSTLHQTFHNIKHSEYSPIAPIGCLQYFMEPRGTIKSFNFPNGYLGDLYYAICFARDVDDCGIRFKASPGDFALDDPTGSHCNDYLTIVNEGKKDRFCGNSFVEITSKAPGQFQVIFKTDSMQNSANTKGFMISYERLKICE